MSVTSGTGEEKGINLTKKNNVVLSLPEDRISTFC